MEVSRREIKFLISVVKFRELERMLTMNMKRDEHAINGEGYTVRSLYFDSIYGRDYNEVLDGVETRKKIRLRVYSPQDTSVKLEYKFKSGANQIKSSLVMDRQQAHKVIQGDYGFLLERKEPIARRIYQDMMCEIYRPRVLVEYERLAYLAPMNDIRVTFDTRVRCTRINMDLFDSDVIFGDVMPGDLGVLEVKYNGFLPTYLQRALTALDELPTAMSKYVLSCNG